MAATSSLLKRGSDFLAEQATYFLPTSILTSYLLPTYFLLTSYLLPTCFLAVQATTRYSLWCTCAVLRMPCCVCRRPCSRRAGAAG